MGRSVFTDHIDAPPEKVWEVLSNVYRRPEFEMAVVEVKDLSGPIDKVGTRWTEVRTFPLGPSRHIIGSHRAAGEFRVKRVEPGRLLELGWIQGQGGEMIVRHTLEPEGTGTKKIVESEYTLPGGAVGAFLDKLIVNRFLRRHPRESNLRLKAIVESEYRGDTTAAESDHA